MLPGRRHKGCGLVGTCTVEAAELGTVAIRNSENISLRQGHFGLDWIEYLIYLRIRIYSEGQHGTQKLLGQSLRFISRTHMHVHTHIHRMLCNDNVYLYIPDILFLSYGCQQFCFLQKKNKASDQNGRVSHGNKVFGSSLGSLFSSDYEAS